MLPMSKVIGNYQAIEFFIVNLSLHQRLNSTSSSKAITLGERQALCHVILGVSERLIRYFFSRCVLPNHSLFLCPCMCVGKVGGGRREGVFKFASLAHFC